MRRCAHILLYMVMAAGAFMVSSCVEPPLTPPDTPDGPEIEETPALEDAYHEKYRSEPYPKENNGIFINPAPLIVPQEMKKDAKLEFELCMNPSFRLDDPTMIRSEAEEWCMFNPHRVLDNGTWYWRFRSVSAALSSKKPWSETYSFEITDDIPKFVTPPFSAFIHNAPTTHPRLYCFLEGKYEQARKNIEADPEYKNLESRANTATNYNWGDWSGVYKDISTLENHITWLMSSWYLTGNKVREDRLYEILSHLISTPPSKAQYFADNFTASSTAYCYLACYDLLYNRLNENERSIAEEQIMRFLSYYYPRHVGAEENHIFDNHFWQHNMRGMMQACLMLWDTRYASEVSTMMEYFYELWTARAPASGFNRDGMWHNGTGYFTANFTTLSYMPMLLSFVTGEDFLKHPWYLNAGRSLVFSEPPRSANSGFGDGSEKYSEPDRHRVAFADFLARETGDSYAGWYANECKAILETDYALRLYRVCSKATKYDTSLPEDTGHMDWYRDIGEVAVQTNIKDTYNNLALSFRSSVFGSGSHTSANQNAFNIIYGGKVAFRSSGYYTNFSDAHNLMSYRHTRAHNTILINGIGQPYTMRAFGNIMRAMSGDNLSYCLGDASKAYCGVSEDQMWIDAFAAAGLAQTPEYGFGDNPLTKYRRHLVVLHDINAVVVYDELEASESAKWEWLLHSPVAFDIDPDSCSARTSNEGSGVYTGVRLFSNEKYEMSQSNLFAVAPSVSNPEDYPNQWHLSACTENAARTRILAIIQVGHSASSIKPILMGNGVLSLGDWKISATLDAEKDAALSLKNISTGTTLVLSGTTSLYDSVNGEYTLQEQSDNMPISTKNVL